MATPQSGPDGDIRESSRPSPPFSPGNLSDQELQALLGVDQKEIKDVNLDDIGDLISSEGISNTNNNNLHHTNQNIANGLNGMVNAGAVLEKIGGARRSPVVFLGPMVRTTGGSYHGAGMKNGHDSCASAESNELHINLASAELKKRCKGLGLRGVTNASIMSDRAPPPAPPEPPKVLVSLLVLLL